MTTIIILAIILALGSVVAGMYNGFIKKNVNVDEAWSDIDVQLKRRYDLIPNLVETVKGYASHEKETLAAVLEARAKATSMNIDITNVTSEQMAQFAGAQSGLSGALGKLMAVAEAYPDLKANENFSKLQDEITVTEDKIQAARRFYNSTVREINIAVQVFPANIFAKIFGFDQKEFFDLDESPAERDPVKVSF